MAGCNNALDRSGLKLSVDQASHVVGTLKLDKMQGTEKADVDYDLTVVATVKTEYLYE